MENKKRSFFERLTGGGHMDEDEYEEPKRQVKSLKVEKKDGKNWKL